MSRARRRRNPAARQPEGTPVALPTCDPLAPLANSTAELIAAITTPHPDTPILNAWVETLGAARIAALLSDDATESAPDATPAEPDDAEPEPAPTDDVADAPGNAEPEPGRETTAGPDDPADDDPRQTEPDPASDAD
jgi:hypothetical protein